MRRVLPPAFAVAALVIGCGSPDQQEPPARDSEPSPAADAAGRDDRALDAPAPAVGEAVREAALEVHEGSATFYADMLEGRPTASGRPLRQSEMVAAHAAFPFGTRLRVTNVENGREVEVEVIDRGPFGREGKTPAMLDLSRAAAERLGFIDAGRAQVRVEVLEWGT